MKTKQKLYLIIFGQTITALIYAILYLIISFVIWHFRNPFYWILNLKNFSHNERFLILFYLIFYYSVLYGFIYKDRNFILTKFFK